MVDAEGLLGAADLGVFKEAEAWEMLQASGVQWVSETCWALGLS